MKKKLISIGLGLAMAGSARATTVTHFTSRMINGALLCVSNSVTITTASTNYNYYQYSAGTNVLAGGTNAAGNLIPYALTDAQLVPDINADVNPNLAIQVVIGYTNNLFLSGVTSPVMYNTVWTNPTSFFGNSVTQTNTATITLSPISSGDFTLPDTTGVKTFSFTVNQTNQTPVVLTTNLPVAFLQGAWGLRASVAVGAGTGNGTGMILNGLSLVGFKP